MYLVELRKTIQRFGKIILIPLPNIQNHTGFRSVYAYDEATSQLIISRNSTADLRGVPVYSDTLFLDFDNQPEASKAFSLLLNAMGIDYRAYHSGGRSHHFHVTVEPMLGSHVPSSQKAWVKLHAPLADISFYHTAGMYRLDRTRHIKYVGKFKRLLFHHAGKPLNIDEVEFKSYDNQMPLTEPEFIKTSNEYDYLLFSPASDGNRRPTIYKIIKTGLAVGISIEQITYDVMRWNRLLPSPHGDRMIMEFIDNVVNHL